VTIQILFDGVEIPPVLVKVHILLDCQLLPFLLDGLAHEPEDEEQSDAFNDA